MKKRGKTTGIVIIIIILLSISAVVMKKANTVETTVPNENTTVKYEETTAKYEGTTAIQEEKNVKLAAISKAKVGFIVFYGYFEQDNNLINGRDEIAWLVLAVEDGKALLISEKILDAMPYNIHNENITWENSSIRSWLNDGFYNSSFTSTEKLAVATTKVINNDNPIDNTPGGNDTQDKVFLLSYKEVKKYFVSDSTRQTKGTDFAKTNGLNVSEDSFYLGNGNWWLRSPGYYPYDAGLVTYDGKVIDYDYNNGAYSTDVGVRPAIWVNY
ncbi:MAG: DUF6273 domain-containing protein [Eubacteriales bacterium]